MSPDIAVDVSMVGYLRGPRLGSLLYDLISGGGELLWLVPLIIPQLGDRACLPRRGLLVRLDPAILVGSILAAHVGMDRLAGYGLKYPTDFKDTHLGRIGR